MKKDCKVLNFLILGILFCGIAVSCKDKTEDKGNSDYFSYNGHSYMIVKQSKTWVDAAVDAASMGGYLAEIESSGEQNAIWQAIIKAGISSTYAETPDGGGIGYIWIGATDRYNEGTWVWNGANQSGNFPVFWLGNNKGSAVAGSYNNWGGKSAGKYNEPDNYTDNTYSPNGQNAAAIGLASWPKGSSTSSALGIAGEWNDIAETNRLYYIVEFDSEK